MDKTEKTAMQLLKEGLEGASLVCDNEDRRWVYTELVRSIDRFFLKAEQDDHERIKQETIKKYGNA